MSTLATTDLRIHGMTCAGCVASVERALRAVPGVATAAVNLMTESARVQLADGAVPRETLLTAVRGAGYDAEILSTSAKAALPAISDAAQKETLRRHRQALITALGPAPFIILLDHFGPHLFGHSDASQLSYRLMQFVLLLMMGVGPAGAPILVGGVRALVHRSPNMDSLIALGVLAAFFSSVYGAFDARDASFVHLHAAAMILGLVCLGRYLEARAKGKASAAVAALAKRAPKTALVRRGDRFVESPADKIAVGDVVQAPTHAAIAVDGEVIDGEAAIDESLMTGEPMPARRSVGDHVLGGTVVVDGMIQIRATSTGADSALGRIMQLVAQAQSGRTQMQRLADQVAAIFTPIVIGIAVVTFAGWWLMGGEHALSSAARAAIAVLVVACPCALGLATPTVVVVASGVAALRGILVREPAMLEAMGRVDTAVWDKTGTLTVGQPTLRAVRTLANFDEPDCLRLAAAAEQLSPHPLARAIVDRARQIQIEWPTPASFHSTPGRGVSAQVDDHAVLVGSVDFLRGSGVDIRPLEPTHADARSSGDTVASLAVDGRAAAAFVLSDTLRPAARDAVQRLTTLRIESHLVTGDAEAPANNVAAQAGIPTIRAAASPADKIVHVESLRQSGRRVAMIGDGVNDAAALAAADVGVAFATGADVAGEAAGINLVGSSPQLVADAVVLARAAVRLIRQNLFWAFAYNIVMIPLAAIGRLPPSLAAAAMMVSSLTVVVNALRLPRAVGWPASAAPDYHAQPR